MERVRLFLIAALIFSCAPPLRAQDNAQPMTPSVMSSAYGDKLKIRGVPNPGKISEWLYRGAQPNEQGLEELKKLGITTIVDLRAEDRSKSDWEKKEAERLGMHFVHIPIAGFAAPTNEEVVQFLSLVRSSTPQDGGQPTTLPNGQPQKIFVHCLLGEDRTGVFIATYRMSVQRWPVEQAMREMNNFGFNGFWHPAMKAFVRDFPARLTSAPALAALQNPKSPVAIVAAPKSN
ncbi:MAG: tyrosine-protein phosphatase [Acidobacteriota bacterium]|nr:tyrosine-protein phosphatase [Acidobacteriota bacterium]